jgi:hypothetical protein
MENRQNDAGYEYIRQKENLNSISTSGLVVKSIVAIDGPRVRFAASAIFIRAF